jgi:acetyltransferase-like isoleucine patch superfamily enzyme
VTENTVRGIKNRLFQLLARVAPGAESFRVWLHRSRGVNIGKGVWIGYDAIIETSRPSLVTIDDGAAIGIRATIIAHFRETQGVTIGKNAFIGPGAILLPGVVIGEGAVITAGSVVSKSIPPMVVAQGNPAVPVARCGVPLLINVSVKEFSRKLHPLSLRRDKT